VDQYGVEDTVFCEVDITIFYNFIRTTKFAHMNGHWKDYDFKVIIWSGQKSKTKLQFTLAAFSEETQVDVSIFILLYS